jgi:hypothetical protein
LVVRERTAALGRLEGQAEPVEEGIDEQADDEDDRWHEQQQLTVDAALRESVTRTESVVLVLLTGGG